MNTSEGNCFQCEGREGGKCLAIAMLKCSRDFVQLISGAKGDGIVMQAAKELAETNGRELSVSVTGPSGGRYEVNATCFNESGQIKETFLAS